MQGREVIVALGVKGGFTVQSDTEPGFAGGIGFVWVKWAFSVPCTPSAVVWRQGWGQREPDWWRDMHVHCGDRLNGTAAVSLCYRWSRTARVEAWACFKGAVSS